MAITCYKILVLQENGDVGSLYTYGIIWMFRVPASAPGDHSVTFNTRAFDGSCATFWKARRPEKYTENVESGCDCFFSISDAAIDNSPRQYG